MYKKDSGIQRLNEEMSPAQDSLALGTKPTKTQNPKKPASKRGRKKPNKKQSREFHSMTQKEEPAQAR